MLFELGFSFLSRLSFKVVDCVFENLYGIFSSLDAGKNEKKLVVEMRCDSTTDRSNAGLSPTFLNVL